MIERKKGHIINIASIAGKVGSANRAVYCASKFGVVGFTESLAEEVGSNDQSRSGRSPLEGSARSRGPDRRRRKPLVEYQRSFRRLEMAAGTPITEQGAARKSTIRLESGVGVVNVEWTKPEISKLE